MGRGKPIRFQYETYVDPDPNAMIGPRRRCMKNDYSMNLDPDALYILGSVRNQVTLCLNLRRIFYHG